MRKRILFLLIGLVCVSGLGNVMKGQEKKALSYDLRDSVSVVHQDSTIRSVMMTADSIGVPEVKMKTAFKPNPTKAVLYAIVPGLGQIYNRKYWKLPIVYGGLMGCTYAITWNNKNYKDYSMAYKDIMYDAAVNPNNPDKWSDSWQILTSMEPSEAIKDSNFKDRLKRQKDYFRRYRDLSIIITVGVYALSIVDAYVDAQLFDFDITPDLSMHVEPTVTPKTSVTPRTYGLNCSLKF